MLYIHTKTGRSKGGKTERETEGGGEGGGGGELRERERERERERWERAIYMSTIITYSIGVGEEWKGKGYALHVFTKQHANSFSLGCVSDWLLYLFQRNKGMW